MLGAPLSAFYAPVPGMESSLNKVGQIARIQWAMIRLRTQADTLIWQLSRKQRFLKIRRTEDEVNKCKINSCLDHTGYGADF
jgi:hypothetical protein